MRRNKLLLGITCLTASTALFAGTAHADRRTGLAGNLLIQDPDDLFPFPQLTLTHRNMIRLDYGGASTSGNGVLTLGDENKAFGIALHRGDLLSPDVVGFNQELVWLGGVNNPFNSTANIAGLNGPATPTTNPAGAAGPVLPATVFDLFFATRMGDNAFGARLGFGRGVLSVKDDGDATKGTNNFIAAQVGYSISPPEGLRLDLSGNAVVAFAKSTAAAGGMEDDVSKGLDARVGLLARGYYGWNQLVDIGFLGNVSFDYEKTTNEGADNKSTNNQLNAMAGVGPAIHLDRAQIAAYAGFTLGFNKNEPNDDVDDDETKGLGFAAPMVNMATEVQLLDWLFVRTGAQYTWGVNRAKSTNGAGDDHIEKATSGVFNWSAGLGVVKNNFYLDGVISNAFMTNGPAFIGGGTPGFLAMASATYKFGDVFSGAGTPAGAPEQVVEPVPAVEPAAPVEPAPVEPPQEAAPPAVEGAIDATPPANGAAVNTGASASGSIGIGR
jgi:hypothetical protein